MKSTESTWRETLRERIATLRADRWEHEFGRHYHEHFVVAVNAAGAHESWYRGAHHRLVAGSVAVIPPAEIHTGRRVGSSPWHYRGFYPTMGALAAIASEVADREVTRIGFDGPIFSDPGLARAFVDAQRSLDAAEAAAGEARTLEALATLVSRYGRWRGRTRTRPSLPSRHDLERVWALIAERGHESLSLEDMATAAGLSRYQTLRAFRRHYGLTPHEALYEWRLERALERLRQGDSIADIAYATGFSDQSHLTRRFRAKYGVTPGQLAAR